MKIAVINVSGNVGKTMIAHHLLAPRIPEAKVIAVESINAAEGQHDLIQGRQFGQLQEYLQSVHNVVVEIGASNVEELLSQMQRYRGSHEDFDYFIVPTVPTKKQQQDTIVTLMELRRLGISPEHIRLVFNLAESRDDLQDAFKAVLAYLNRHPLLSVSTNCRIGFNEIYGRVSAGEIDLATLAADTTNFKALIAAAPDPDNKVSLARQLANRRLASGVVPDLDACFAALDLDMSLAETQPAAA